MIELCFSESMYGSLCAAPRKLEPDREVSDEHISIDFSRREGISNEDAEKYHQRTASTIPFETALSDLYYFDFDLSIGDITQPAELSKGPREKLYVESRLIQEYENRSVMISRIEKSWYKMLDSYERFKKRIQNGEAVRIWLDSAPSDICGFLFAMELLSQSSSNVSVIVLPKYEVINGCVIEHSSWGEIDPFNYYRYISKEQTLPKELIKALAWKWHELKNENAPMRAAVNGNIVSVEEDFYDSLIRRAFPFDECSVGAMISEIIANQRLLLSDYFIAMRIKKMLENGELIYHHQLDHDFYHSIIAVNK